MEESKNVIIENKQANPEAIELEIEQLRNKLESLTQLSAFCPDTSGFFMEMKNISHKIQELSLKLKAT